MTIINSVYTGIGKRKTSISKVYLIKGKGKIILNNNDITNLSINKNIDLLKLTISNIYQISNLPILYDTYIQVKGGGINSQIGSISLAICKSICNFPDSKPIYL